MNQDFSNPSPIKRPALIATGVIGVLVLSVWGLRALLAGPKESPGAGLDTEPVIRAGFVDVVPAEGDVRTFMPTVVYNDCRYWEREIIEVIPEGSIVKEGDVVVVLDSSELEDKLQKQQIELSKAQGQLADMQAKQKLVDAENQRLLAKFQMQANLAANNLRSFEDATSASERRRLEGQQRLTSDQFSRARETLDTKAALKTRGFGTTTELDLARTFMEQRQRERDQAASALSLNSSFLEPRQRLELNGISSIADKDLEYVDLQNQLLYANAEVRTLKTMKWVAGTQGYVDYLTKAIAACTMRAPKAGEIVYAHKRHENRMIEVGAKVHYCQNIFRITNRDKLVIAGRVSDRLVYNVKVGQKADIEISNQSNGRVTGTVKWVGEIPTALNWYEPDILHHKLQIMLDGTQKELADIALGSTAEVSIITDQRSDILQAPLKGIFSYNGQLSAVVRTKTGLELRAVEVGQNNGETAEVIDGLREGEEVIIENRTRLRELARELYVGT